MPSDLPKVTTYLKPEAYEALDAAAAALGQSRSRLVADLVEASIPVLGVITDAARVLKNATGAQREAMAKAADDLGPLMADQEQMTAEVMRIIGSVGGKG